MNERRLAVCAKKRRFHLHFVAVCQQFDTANELHGLMMLSTPFALFLFLTVLCVFGNIPMENSWHLRTVMKRRATANETMLNRYLCTREERLSGRCRWCNRDYPMLNGVWSSFPPYWQQPPPCHMQAFDEEDTQKCLKGRKVYAIGNSIARQVPFNLVKMLGGNPIKREDQRDQCAKNDRKWGDSCHREIAGVELKYLYLQFMDGMNYTDRGGFPYFRYRVNDTSEWRTGKYPCEQMKNQDGSTTISYCDNAHGMDADRESPLKMEDNCMNQDVRSCLANFFNESRKHDILIFTTGMSAAMSPVTEEPALSPGLDGLAWARGAGAAFKAHIAATFPGQVFRFTNAPFSSDGMWQNKSHNLRHVNDALWDVWQPDSTDLPWYTIDQWPINQHRPHLYDDHVHFNGPLTQAMLHQVLNELCPGGGKTTWHHPGVGHNLTAAHFAPMKPMVLRIADHGANLRYAVLLNNTRHNISDLPTQHFTIADVAHIHVTGEDAEIFPEGEAVPPCDLNYRKKVCDENVFYKALHGL